MKITEQCSCGAMFAVLLDSNEPVEQAIDLYEKWLTRHAEVCPEIAAPSDEATDAT